MLASLTEADLTALDSSNSRRSSDTCNSRSLLRDHLHSGSSSIAETVSSISCVTRETSRDECATHRFIVWAAVKRNSCQRMSDSERLECPLLRCRKRFTNHELMLRHLADCEHLPSCEYWCYECMKVERFNDSRCKRCLGHPSKRRKMLSMAKSFFSHLGHKPRKGQTLDYDGEDISLPPPSYDSLEIQSPIEAELQSNEIVEIDSVEISSIVVDAPVPQETSPTRRPPQPTDPVIDPQALLLSVPELDSTMIPFQSSMNWQPTPPPPSITEPLPDTSMLVPDQFQSRLSGLKPSLQVNTHGLEQYRHVRPAPRPAPSAPRSKNLSPSSSVRSTTSTMSNISSIISPISAWSSTSNAWSGTCLTSPASELVSPGGFLPNDTCAEDMNNFNDTCPTDFLHEMFSELPADIPAILPSDDFSGDDLLFPSMDANPTTDLGYAANIVLTEEKSESLPDPLDESLEQAICCSETQDLVSSSWDMLQEHIVNSLVNIEHIQHNPLAEQLKTLSAKTIATNGLRVLRNLLDGQRPRSAIDTLCFVHVVYSFSLVVYEDDALTRSDKFFAQSLAYARYFAPADQSLYKDVAIAIWRPDGITREHLATIMNQSAALERTPSVKGKEREISGQTMASAKDDALVSAARNFLDELEASVILSESSSHELLTTELWTKHHQLSGIESSPNSPFAITVGYVMNVLAQQYSDFPGLNPQLKEVNHRVMKRSIGSVRRVELEILQAGKNYMPPAAFFDDYVPQVRSLCDPIYQHHDSAGVSRRNDYYGCGIALVESLVSELSATPIEPMDLTNDLCLDEFLTSFTDELDEDFLSEEPLLATRVDDSLLKTMSGPSSTGSSVQSTADTTPATSSSTESSPSNGQAQKVEANSCCEICGYRPKGAPQWFKGSMAKHKKLQHSTDPPKIYKCPFPGCNSQYRNRPDNLRQHQIEKDHFVSGDETVRRPSKRKKIE